MLPARNGIEDSRQFDLEPGHERTLRRLVEQHGGLAQQRFARPVLIGEVKREQAFRPPARRGFATRGGFEPAATGGAHGVADHAIGVIGALEPRGVRLDEGFEQRKRGERILRQQFVRDLVEPLFEGMPEIPRVAVADGALRTPPAGQRPAEAGGELVRPVGELHARESRPDIVVAAGDVEQHGDQVARIQTAEERLEVFGGRLGHSCMASTIRRRQTPALACARNAGFASMA